MVVPSTTVDLGEPVAVTLPPAAAVEGGQKYRSTVPPVRVHCPQSVNVFRNAVVYLHLGFGPIVRVKYSRLSGNVEVTGLVSGVPSAYTGVNVTSPVELYLPTAPDAALNVVYINV